MLIGYSENTGYDAGHGGYFGHEAGHGEDIDDEVMTEANGDQFEEESGFP